MGAGFPVSKAFRRAVLWVAAIVLSGSPCLYAQQGEGGEIRASGLRAIFPENLRCPGIASAFASRTRYDGSPRPTWSFGGYHGGIDISLPENTPLLALADGSVVAKGEGGMLEGIYLWLRHAPEDTGLAYFVYAKYQHLVSMPEIADGARVNAGQAVARSGKTGTVGKQYGPAGYPHLHLTTVRSASGDAAVATRGTARGVTLFDPLVIYHEARAGAAPAGDKSDPDKAVRIPYVTADSRIWPQGMKVVWPVACQ
jgi:murein DD-endopeptidase MepM/ murein hydrolase activator NlpD